MTRTDRSVGQTFLEPFRDTWFNWFTLFVCLAILGGYETQKRQDVEIKATLAKVEEIRNWLNAKFPPAKWQQLEALERVMEWGNKLHQAVKNIPPEHRSFVSFAWANCVDTLGPCLPRSLGGPIATDGKLANISFLFRNLADQARYLDYEGSQDFLVIGDPSYAAFPDSLRNYLDVIIQREISRLQAAQ